MPQSGEEKIDYKTNHRWFVAMYRRHLTMMIEIYLPLHAPTRRLIELKTVSG